MPKIMVRSPKLASSTTAGATGLTLNVLISTLNASANGMWAIIDPYTIECEVRKISASTGTVTSAITWTSGLTYTHAANDTVLLVDSPILNVKWFGAKGDGATDDRVAINRAVAQLTAGSGLYAPGGTYRVRPLGSNPQMINLSGKTDILIYGDGPESVFEVDPTYNWAGSQPDAHMFLCVGCQRITFRDFKIDGQWDEIALLNPSINEQMHGVYLAGIQVYAQAAAAVGDITFDNVWFYNLRGDGAYLIGDSTYTPDTIKFEHCLFDSNGRSGAAHQSGMNLWYSNCTFRNISDQDLDFEITSPRPFENIYIDNCRFDHEGIGTLSVALTGYSSDYLMKHVKFTNNVLHGALFIRYIDDCEISGNTIIGPDTNGTAIAASFGSYNVQIKDNYIEGNLAADAAIKIDMVTSGGHSIYVSGNTIKVNVATVAISVQNVNHTIQVCNNILTGFGAGIGSIGIDVGVYVAGNGTVRGILIDGNQVKNFGSNGAIRVTCGQNATNSIHTVSVVNNEMYDTQTVVTQTTGIVLDSSDGATFIDDNSIVIMGNIYGRGITTTIDNHANVVAWAIAGNAGGVAVYELGIDGTPEGLLAAPVKSQALRKDGGASTTLYVKTSGAATSTGWTAK